ncbi:MAG: LexA family protein [Eubacteriales bacterium]
MKTTTADRLMTLMESRGLKQCDIVALCKPYCDKYGVTISKNNISQYINGKTSPNSGKLSILGMALNVSEAWLMGYDVPMERNSSSANENIPLPSNIRPIVKKRFPMLGEIACGKPIYAAEDHESYIDASSGIDADFCLTAKGDSMIGARIHDGDVVFIKRMPIVENGQIAAVIIDDEATLKRWYYYPDKQKLMLIAENSAYEPLVYMNEELNGITCLGKAVCFMSNL